ncbi:MAG: hypothetical protein LBF41_00995 [Deltaproteobacteria bacterium]|jgi:hypothetical protein|nr:hypothetical protein [Deltaproteobacteria bacterium]
MSDTDADTDAATRASGNTPVIQVIRMIPAIPTKRIFFVFALTFALCFHWIAREASALPPEETGAPPELLEWEKWVTRDHPQYLCPPYGSERSEWYCELRDFLKLDLTDKGGTFRMGLELRSKTAARLPGNLRAWPTNVVNLKGSSGPVGDFVSMISGSSPGTPVPVLGDDVPRVYLEPGLYELAGEFSWSELPETLPVPMGAFPVVTVNGKELFFPPTDADYVRRESAVWLREKAPAAPGSEEGKVTDPGTPPSQTSGETKIKVERLLTDSVPMAVMTRMTVTVSGPPREETLKSPLLPGNVPLRLESPLPARLVPEGLRIQARPGVHVITLNSRVVGPVDRLGPSAGDFGREYWAFRGLPEIRQVEILGARQVDASRLDIPWTGYPVYEIDEGTVLEFETLRRGDPDPGPNLLKLERQCWLDYSGKGLSCSDELTGRMRRDWFLTADKPFEPGQASIGGVPQVLVMGKNSRGEDAPGIQIREERLRLSADLRIEDFDGIIPASGWDQNLTSGFQTLWLPPGYSLLYAGGAKAADSRGIPASWWDKWTTLDFFIAIVVVFCVYRLIGRKTAILAAFALILSYHEFLAPRMVFLHILAALAILKALPRESRARIVFSVWKVLASLFLVGFVIAFSILQLRHALHPQLEDPDASTRGFMGYPISMTFNLMPAPEVFYDYGEYPDGAADAGPAAADYAFEQVRDEAPKPDGAVSRKNEILAEAPSPAGRARGAAAAAPAPLPPAPATSKFQSLRNSRSFLQKSELAQNSFPRPDWSWKRVNLNPGGQVSKDQKMKIALVPPLANRLLGFLRTILVVWFSLAVTGFDPGDRKYLGKGKDGRFRFLARFFPEKTPALLLLPVLLFLAQTSSSPALADAFPSENLLKDLRTRLLETEDIPNPGIPLLEIDVGNRPVQSTSPSPPTPPADGAAAPANPPGIPRDSLVPASFAMEIEAATEVFVPLPSLDRKIFHPREATLEDGRKIPLVLRADGAGTLLALVPAGKHKLTLSGILKAQGSFQINFPNLPGPKRVKSLNPLVKIAGGANADGWLSDRSLVIEIETIRPPETPAEAKDPAEDAAEGQSEPTAEDPATPEPAAPPTGAAGTGGIEPFFTVERTISLGVEAKVLTEASALFPLDSPVTLALPPVKGENPTSSQVTLSGDRILLNFSDRQRTVSFESSLKIENDTLTLTASEGPYQEVWTLDSANIWDVETAGIAPVLRISPLGFYNPQWLPWPGESVTFEISRPVSAPGRDLVADRGSLDAVVGEDGRKLTLTAVLRSSQGRNLGFNLPPGAEIQSIRLNGSNLPFSGNDPVPEGSGPPVTLPLSPGRNTLAIEWLDPSDVGFATRLPEADLGLLTSNIVLSAELPGNRWIVLAGGPRQGPAVLFWSYAAALLLLSFVLSLTNLTPLGTGSWFLFLLGLGQLPVPAAMIVAGWLLALGLRGKKNTVKNPTIFNFTQIVLCAWTALALYFIYVGLTAGLLEAPDMSIRGNHSSAAHLEWFSDRAEGPWPQPWVLSLPAKAYQYLMLAWALWLAFSIIRWLRWGWKSFSSGALWKKTEPFAFAPKTPAGPGGPGPGPSRAPLGQTYAPRPGTAPGAPPAPGTYPPHAGPPPGTAPAPGTYPPHPGAGPAPGAYPYPPYPGAPKHRPFTPYPGAKVPPPAEPVEPLAEGPPAISEDKGQGEPPVPTEPAARPDRPDGRTSGESGDKEETPGSDPGKDSPKDDKPE